MVVDVGEEAGGAQVRGTLFDIWGKRVKTLNVAGDAAPSSDSDPVVAALPRGNYAVAWTDVVGDGVDLGVALRRVRPDGDMDPIGSANDAAPFPQVAPDMIWTGEELVVAWIDYANLETGPDIHYKRFAEDLSPLSEELVLTDAEAVETSVVLTRLSSGWAAAYRETLDDREEVIVVRSGERSYRIGPYRSAGRSDKPALIALDARHLLVVFTALGNPLELEPEDARLRYAVIDTTLDTSPAFLSLEPPWVAQSPPAGDAHFSPAAEVVPGGAFVAWTSAARSGDGAGDQIWLKPLAWDVEGGVLDLARPRILAPRTCEENVGNQGAPALGRTELPPSGGLILAWEDFARTLDADSGAPDVSIHYAPTHAQSEALGLRRNVPAYRACTPGTPCKGSDGCCLSNDDCAPGYACLASAGKASGLGSHANACGLSD